MRVRWILATLCVASLPVMAKNQPPTHYTLNDNDTTQIALSSVDMNRLMVDDDTISAIHCPTGFCVTGKTDGSGGALLSLANGEPFTLFSDTTKGRHIGVLVLPASTPGKTIMLDVAPTLQEELDTIEHSAGYDAKYVALIKDILSSYWHHTPLQGYQIQHFNKRQQAKRLTRYGVIDAQPLVQYTDGHVTGTVYLLSNHSDDTVPLTPEMFHHGRMPALSLASDRLQGHHVSTLLTLTRER